MNYIEEIQEISDLVTLRLGDESLIVPLDERDCFAAIIAFLKKISPLASGTFPIGDIATTDEIRTVILPYDVGTSNYRVEGSLVSKSANFSNDNDVCEVMKDKTSNSFKLCLREISANTQNMDFEWAIYPKN